MIDISSLYRQHYAYLANLIRKRFGHTVDPDDIIQEVFLSIHRHGNCKDFNSPRAVLSTAVIHKAIDAYRFKVSVKGGNNTAYLEDLAPYGAGEWDQYMFSMTRYIAEHNERDVREARLRDLDILKRVSPGLPRMKRIIMEMKLKGNSNKQIVHNLKLNYNIDLSHETIKYHIRSVKQKHLIKP